MRNAECGMRSVNGGVVQRTTFPFYFAFHSAFHIPHSALLR